MKKLKTISLIAISFILLFTTQSCGKPADDPQLKSFMLGGIYFINGYGGTKEVKKMINDAGYRTESEWASGYKQLLEFPFEKVDGRGISEVLKKSWNITDKESLLSSIDELKTQDTKYKAWDFSRIANNLCMGYAAGYVTKEEVYPILSETLKLAQEKYKTWEEYFTDFDLGRKEWNPDDPEKEVYEKLAKKITKGNGSIYVLQPLHN